MEPQSEPLSHQGAGANFRMRAPDALSASVLSSGSARRFDGLPVRDIAVEEMQFRSEDATPAPLPRLAAGPGLNGTARPPPTFQGAAGGWSRAAPTPQIAPWEKHSFEAEAVGLRQPIASRGHGGSPERPVTRLMDEGVRSNFHAEPLSSRTDEPPTRSVLYFGRGGATSPEAFETGQAPNLQGPLTYGNGHTNGCASSPEALGRAPSAQGSPRVASWDMSHPANPPLPPPFYFEAERRKAASLTATGRSSRATTPPRGTMSPVGPMPMMNLWSREPQVIASIPWPPPPLPPVSDELRTRLEALEAQRNSQQQVEMILERQVEQLRAGLEASIAERDHRFAELQGRFSQAETERDQLREQLRTLEARNAELQMRHLREKDLLQEDVRALEARNADLQQRSLKVVREKDQLEDNVRQIEARNAEIQQRLSRAVNEGNDLEARNAEMQQRFSKAASDVRTSEATRDALNAELQRLMDERQHCQKELQNLKVSESRRQDELQKRLEIAMSEKDHFQQELHHLKASDESHLVELQDLKKRLSAAMSEKDHCQEELQYLKASQGESNSRQESLQQRCRASEETIQRLEGRLRSETADKAELQMQMQDLAASHRALLNEKQDLLREQQVLEQASERKQKSLTDELQLLQGQLVQLQGQLDSFRAPTKSILQADLTGASRGELDVKQVRTEAPAKEAVRPVGNGSSDEVARRRQGRKHMTADLTGAMSQVELDVTEDSFKAPPKSILQVSRSASRFLDSE